MAIDTTKHGEPESGVASARPAQGPRRHDEDDAAAGRHGAVPAREARPAGTPRGVIALKQENCTVCYKCSRECPDWCIYIDAHKETHAGGGRAAR